MRTFINLKYALLYSAERYNRRGRALDYRTRLDAMHAVDADDAPRVDTYPRHQTEHVGVTRTQHHCTV